MLRACCCGRAHTATSSEGATIGYERIVLVIEELTAGSCATPSCEGPRHQASPRRTDPERVVSPD
jgi:hypothetical protein